MSRAGCPAKNFKRSCSAITDIRKSTAQYYDLQPAPYGGADIPFYVNLVPFPNARVLELGCGTGRVLIPIAAHCSYILGVDSSDAMLDVCRERLSKESVPPDRAAVQLGDITDLDLGQTFDLITAPFRVMQNLETDAQLDGLFETIRRHLAPGGSAILNAFKPYGPREDVLTRSRDRMQGEQFINEVELGAGKLIRHETMRRVSEDPLIVYPSLINRYYENGELKDEAVLDIAMRCYYPDEYVALIEGHGFTIINKWGGYSGEVYGEGPELVVQFVTL